MHRIDRMVAGCRRLAQADYAKIAVVPTGDELEELGRGFNHMVEGLEERDRLRTTFGKYMTDAVVSHLLANRVELGGDTLPVTVLFSDIRGFTSIREQLDAQSLVALLNEYFTEMVDIVMDYGGVVDKSSATPSWWCSVRRCRSPTMLCAPSRRPYACARRYRV